MAKSSESSAEAAINDHRLRVAILMTSDLFGGGKIPKPKTPIDQWTKQVQVQIAWAAKLNASSRPTQFGYGWNRVFASEIGGCKFIEDLIGLVYDKLEPPSPTEAFTEDIEAFAAALSADDSGGSTVPTGGTGQ